MMRDVGSNKNKRAEWIAIAIAIGLGALVAIVFIALLPTRAQAGYADVDRIRAAVEAHKKCHQEGNALAKSNYSEYQKRFGDFRGMDRVCGERFDAVLNSQKK